MTRRAGWLCLALALPWGACEDHTVELAEGGGDTSSSNDIGPSTTTSTNTSTSTSSSSSAVTGDWGGNAGGTQNQGTVTSGSTTGMPCPWPCQDAGGTGGTGNHAVNTAAGGMPGLNTSTGFTTGSNEGGAGSDCADDPECLLCKIATRNCITPTPDCPDREGYERECNMCDNCAFGTCYKGYQCRMPCESNQNCPRDEHCDPEEFACVHCYDDSQCGGPEPHCLDGECVECVSRSDCDDQHPHCLSGRCIECLSDSECGEGYCSGFQCVECRFDNDCMDPNTEYCLLGKCEEV